MKIGIASDHAGYELKSTVIKEFKNDLYKLVDYGCDSASISVDYPDFANKLCEKIIAKEIKFGILICGSGIGVCIAANRFNEVRAALCSNQKSSILSRKHNDANVLCLGSRIIKKDAALKCIKAFLSAEFEGGRHERRIKKLFKNETK